jgi:hypothetical protein
MRILGVSPVFQALGSFTRADSYEVGVLGYDTMGLLPEKGCGKIM